MSECDVIIVGAGSAGIAAGRLLQAAGVDCRIVEARAHVGGRAVTRTMRGHPIDLGAHWMHAGHRNPLVALARQHGERLRPAPPQRHGFHAGVRLDPQAVRRSGLGWARVAQASVIAAAHGPDDAADARLPPLGMFGPRTLKVHGLVCGRPLHETSVKDFAAAQDEDDTNWFIRGGYGAYVARLARGLAVTFGTPVRRISRTSRGLRIDTSSGVVAARAVIVTVPVMVLQQGGIAFEPALPAMHAGAVEDMLAGTYEHVVLHWPNAPFHGQDRLLGISGSRFDALSMMTRIDGSAFHYLELDHPTVDRLGSRRAIFAREAMRETFGASATADMTIQHLTDWRHDPFARGSWSVVPKGRFGLRQVLRQPVEGRLWFAGEATSAAQWGTVGGAWLEGERAAREVLAVIRPRD